jgi:F0F1-type ATP synthase membrane subunit b/b'
MSTIAIIAIVIGAVILLALVATKIFAKPKIDRKRRGKARELRDRADTRRARAEHEQAGATEQRARARREVLESEERREQAEEELQLAVKEDRKAERIDPDR